MRGPKSLLGTATLLLAPAPAAHAQTAADSAAIRSTALDYIEGWSEGDADPMERSLHPHLAKRFQEPMPDGSVRLTETTALELVQQVRNGGGSGVPAADRRTDVRILDVFQDVARVRVLRARLDRLHAPQARARPMKDRERALGGAAVGEVRPAGTEAVRIDPRARTHGAMVSYSSTSVLLGDTLVARNAGIDAASRAATNRAPVAVRRIRGSVASVRKRREARTRPSASEPASPIARPAAVTSSP